MSDSPVGRAGGAADVGRSVAVAGAGAKPPADVRHDSRAKRGHERAAAARVARIAHALDTDAAAVGTILILLLLAFSPWWLGGRIIAPLDILHEAFAPWHGGDGQPGLHNHFTSDAVTQYIGYRAFAERSFTADGRIGWSDLTGGGRPEYANTMALYGDWTMQLHRVLPFWSAWHLGLMAQLLVAALGMYVLLRSQGVRPLTACTGAIAFAGSTPLLFTLYHRWHLSAFAWVPWMLWAMLRWRGGSRAHWALVPVFLALALAGGSLQTAAFVVIVLAAVAAGWAWESRGEAVVRGAVVHVAAWSVLGALLAAFSLLPALLTYLDAADLHGARNAPGYAHGLMQPLLALAFIPLQAVPTLLGSPQSLDLAKLFRADLALVAFFGLVPTLVAMRCVAWRGAPVAARLMIAAGLFIPLTPLVGSLYHRVQIVFVVGGVWACALFWDAAAGASVATWQRIARVATGLLAAWLVVSIALWALEPRLTDVVQGRVGAMIDAGAGGQLGGFREWLLARAASIIRELRIWHPAQLVAVTGALLGLLALRLRAGRHAQLAALVLLAAVTVELGGLAVRWHTAVDPARYAAFPVTPDIAVLQDVARGGRVHIARSHDGPAPFFPPNTLAMYGVATIEQYETVDIHGMWQLAGRATDVRTLGALAVAHAVAPPGTPVDDGWRLVHAGATFDIWSNDASVPHYIPAGADVGAAIEHARSGDDGSVRLVAGSANRRVLSAGAGVTAIRVAENWSEGWRFREESGSWRAAEPAGDRSMLLQLTNAGHERNVELEYRPRRRSAGMALSLLGAILTLAGAAGAAARARAAASRPAAPVPDGVT